MWYNSVNLMFDFEFGDCVVYSVVSGWGRQVDL